MNELFQLPDVTIISDDNRINLCFPLIVSPGCWLPAAVLGDDPKGEKGKLREFPSFPLLGFLWGKRAELTLAFVGFRADLWQVRRESWSTLEPQGQGGAQSCSLELQRGVLLFRIKEVSQHCFNTPWAAQ